VKSLLIDTLIRKKDKSIREVVLHGWKREPVVYEFGSRHICTGDAERNDLPGGEG
jgi:hypothetical protein